MKHEVYLQEMLDAHRGTLEESFGPSLVELRERFERIGTTAGYSEIG